MTEFPYAARSAAIRAELRAKLEAQKALFYGVKPERRKVLAETVVEGKLVSQWAGDIELLVSMADDEHRAQGKLVVLDMSEHFPAAAVEAYNLWVETGRPTEYDDTAHKLQRLRDESEKFAALAINDDNKADKFEAMKNAKKTAQHRKYAQTNRDKAAKFLAEAEALEIEYRKEHP